MRRFIRRQFPGGTMMKIHAIVLSLSCCGMLLTASATAQSQGLVTQKAISADMAQQMVQGALEKCRSQNYHIGVSVLDADGQLKAFLRDDKSSQQTIDVSRRKAYTALILGMPSMEVVKFWAKLGPIPPVI